jgi:hypothetical protein
LLHEADKRIVSGPILKVKQICGHFATFYAIGEKATLDFAEWVTICGKFRKRVRWKTIGFVQRNAHCINPESIRI